MSYEWFRQGWRNGDSIQLKQLYTLEEAKLRCELGYTKESNLSFKQKPILMSLGIGLIELFGCFLFMYARAFLILLFPSLLSILFSCLRCSVDGELLPVSVEWQMNACHVVHRPCIS